MEDIYFSVVIPLYNKEKHIRRAIDSVLNQSYQNFEIIIVDDGSTDKGASRVREYSDDRINLISQKNQGVSAARNKGIKAAKYEYIGLLDADDAWKKNFLKEISLLINDYPNKAVYATAYEFYLEDDFIKKAQYSNLPNNFRGEIDNYFKYTLKNPLISASSVVISKNIFDSVGFFDTSLTRGEDLDMWFRISLNEKITFIYKSLAIYYLNSTNRASNKNFDYSKTFTNKLQYSMEDLINNNCENEWFLVYLNKKMINKAKYYILNGFNKKGRSFLKSNNVIESKKFYFYYLLSFIPKKIIDFLRRIKNIK